MPVVAALRSSSSLSVPHPPRLSPVSPALALLVMLSAAVHLFFSDAFHGHKTARSLSRRTVIPAYATAAVLSAAALARLAHFVALVCARPPDADLVDLLFVAVAALALTHSGLLAADQRSRHVAVLVASVPCCGDGSHSAPHHRLLPRNAVLIPHVRFLPVHPHRHPSTDPPSAWSPPPAPVISPVSSSTSECTPEKHLPPDHRHTLHPLPSSETRAPTTSSLKPSRHAGRIKRRVWEMPCRSSSPWVHGRASSPCPGSAMTRCRSLASPTGSTRR